MSDIPSPIEENMSFGNPTDLAMMKKAGTVSPDMSIRDFLASKGIDVDGPITQLERFAMKQMANSTMLGKAQNMSPAAGAEQPPPPRAGLGDLLRGA